MACQVIIGNKTYDKSDVEKYIASKLGDSGFDIIKPNKRSGYEYSFSKSTDAPIITTHNNLTAPDIGDFNQGKLPEKEWAENPDKKDLTGGSVNDTFRDAANRIFDAKTDLEKNAKDKTAVVTHSKNVKLWNAIDSDGIKSKTVLNKAIDDGSLAKAYLEGKEPTNGADEKKLENGKSLYLIRHGETTDDEAGVDTGQSNIPLSKDGKANEEKRAETVYPKDISNIVASPLERAQQTAKIIQKHLAQNALDATGGKWTDETTDKFVAEKGKQSGEQETPQPNEGAINNQQSPINESKENNGSENAKSNTQAQDGNEENGKQKGNVTKSEKEGGAASPPSESDDSYTSIKNKIVDKERAKRGFEPAMEAAHKEFGESWDEATKELDQNPNAGKELVDKLNTKSFPLSDKQNAILLHEQIEKQNEYERINDAINKSAENGDEEAVQENRIRLAKVSDELQDIYNAGKKSGTESGRGLATRKMLAKNDYSLASMETQKRAANNGKSLDPKVQAEIQALHDKIETTRKAFEDYVKKADEQRTKDIAKKEIVRQVEKIPKIKKTHSEYVRERRDILDSIKDKLKKSRGDLQASVVPYAKELVEIAPDVAKLTRSLVEEGIDKLEDVATHIYDNLKEFIPEITKKDVNDLIAGKYNEKKQTRNEITVEVNKLRTQAKLIDKLNDAISGKDTKDPVKEEKKDKIAEDLRQQIKDAQLLKVSKEDIEPAGLRAYKTRITEKIFQLENDLKKSNFEREARKPLVLDKQAQKLQAEYERTKNQFKIGIEKDRLKNRTIGQKVQDAFIKFETASKLSNPETIAKLFSTGMTSIAETPLKEVSGVGWGLLFPKLRKAAERQGGLNIKAEGHALVQGFTKGMDDAYKIITTGKSDLDAIYGKQDKLPPELIGFLGTLHNATKALTKRNEFTRSLEKRINYNIKRGVDVHDPIIMTRIAMDAYKDANSSIFLKDNLISDMWKNGINMLEKSNNSFAKPTATVARFLIPFVKVPTNIVKETAIRVGGLPVGLGEGVYHTIKSSITGKEVNPEQADIILNHLKTGSLGAAALSIGYFNPKSFGGFYNSEDNNKKHVGWGNIKIGDTEIPKLLLEAPIFQAMQLGATVRHIVDAHTHNKKDNGIGDAIGQSALGLTQEIPMVNEANMLTKLEHPNERGQFLSSLAKSTLEPTILQKTAEWTDIHNGHLQDRKAKGLWEQLKSGVPVARETLKVNKNKK